ncbi:CpaD family pilus assembly protein [Chthonobacter rhizosphaerae]|uniref:CpaD family pilus assembly protein n=1 Tax=Chthonobacter rhizosphaerae TaxID=2735553 RepID=UPI0015EF80A7|nr:CpaD family pilus assembly protein [Chthonobacter rhizosphaerae]
MQKLGPSGRRGRRSVAALGLAVAALVTACSTPPDVTGSLPSDDWRKRNPITVEEAPETLDIPVGYGSPGLAPNDRDRVLAFAADAREKATGSLVIMVPSGAANDVTAAAVARSVHATVQRAGLPRALVETRPYAVAEPDAAAPIRLSYSRIKAVSPPCGAWTENLYRDGTNDSDREFGCSTQANLAAMVADPQDLIAPRAPTPISGARRSNQYGKWVAGESPASSAPVEGGSVSSVGGGG